MDGYDYGPMGPQNPIDKGLREYLRRTEINQAEFAPRIGRKQPWLNKYMHGGGKATIDDVIRIVAALIGTESKPMTKDEQQLVKSFRHLRTDEDRADLLEYAQLRARRARHAKSKESSAPAARTHQEIAHKARGKQ